MSEAQDTNREHEERPDLQSVIEALLFVSPEAVAVSQLAQVLGATRTEIERALLELSDHYQSRGLRLQRQDGLVQFTTSPEAASCVERFLGLDLSSRLSAAALETLALIAYRQPITRAEIEAIRGVSCDGVLRTLVSRSLVSAQGRLEQAGRPIVYGTTLEFLQYFGLSCLDALPAVEDFGAMTEGGGRRASRRTTDEAAADEAV